MITVQDCVQAACQASGVSRTDVLSQRRKPEFVTARQVGMKIARDLTQASFPQIGRAFGRDHTTVMHAEERIRERAASEAYVRDLYVSCIREAKRIAHARGKECCPTCGQPQP